ncbi:MAG: S1/P1 nuclease [Pseudomonadota bacterium]|nr:S1/P1 nuclease [Pseudomonadota bacterium]
MRRSLLMLVFAALLLATTGPAAAWGTLGHRLVAALAWDELDPQARAEITALLAGEAEPTLPGIANWADDLRANDPELGKRSARWHYVNIAEHGCAYDAVLACRGGDCVVAAIRAQTAILADRNQPKAARLQALKFVVHFVGDVHQPMHAGYGHDRGGNDVQLNVPDGSKDGSGSNLHALWDSGLLRTTGLDEAAYLQRLRALPLTAPLPCDAAAWAEASCHLVVQPGLYPPGAKIGDAYVQRWLPVAEMQLRRGGNQLARLLARTLGS